MTHIMYETHYQERTMADGKDRLLTLQGVADYLGLGADHRDPVSAVRYLCRTRKLKHVKVGKTIRIKPTWVDDFIQNEAVPTILEMRNSR